MGQAASLSQAPSLNIQPSPLQLHSRPNHPRTQGVVPPRSGPTPQLLSNQIPTQAAPNVSHQYPYQIPSAANGQHRTDHVQLTLPPPLEKTPFETAYKTWCTSKGLHHDARIMSIEARPIDLYALHTHVMKEGGYHKVRADILSCRSDKQNIAPG
jgi:ARID/BRIGHT DNA binding domain